MSSPSDHPPAVSIAAFSFDDLQQMLPHKHGWWYPDRLISRYSVAFPAHQKLAITVAVSTAFALVFAGSVLAVWKSWWWLGLLIGARIAWQMARSMVRGFFIMNLENDRRFFGIVQASEIATDVKFAGS